jgi:hypothetical protein
MLIDCDTCVMQHTVTCRDCVVTCILEDGSEVLSLSDGEIDAIGNLAAVGLVPRLRLIPRTETAPRADSDRSL